MIEGISLLRNIGQFDSVSPPSGLSFGPFSLIYAENGRGKTTIAAIFRSLAFGDARLINERRRLGSQHAPHIVVKRSGQQHVFQNSAWDKTVPEISIFDDAFVTQNVCSGIEVEASHRQNLHELILGSQGVALNAELQQQIARIEKHNVDLRERATAISSIAGELMSVDAFCALKEDHDIDAKILAAEHRLAAAKSAGSIRNGADFTAISLPILDIDQVNSVLLKTLPNLEAQAATLVREHLRRLGRNGEVWVAEGMTLRATDRESQQEEKCPFCAQSLEGSSIIDHYRAFFSNEYEALKTLIRQTGIGIRDAHGGDVPAAFERDIRTAVENREFWKEFAEVPTLSVDTALISRQWTAARDAALEILRAKAASPLEPMALDQKAIDSVSEYEARRVEITALSTRLLACNAAVGLVKEQVAVDSVATLTNDLNAHKARRLRYDPKVFELCGAYLSEKAAKKATEAQRAKSRDALEAYRRTMFPDYETAINDYLGRFTADFRLGQVTSVNTRAGSSASYCVVINEQNVSISAANEPSFRNTLSAGDRNTLALAFFFASLERTPNLAQRVVIIDDPITSLDEHRSLVTIHEVRKLSGRVSQVIVLSHSKPFLCALWEGAEKNSRTAIRIGRATVGSEMAPWDVRSDSVTEHDRHYDLVSRYCRAADPTIERAVAAALRPILEAFMRVAYPADFPPGTVLGKFERLCRSRLGSNSEILSGADTDELRSLLDYANRFHHDANPAWQTAAINDRELEGFANRTLLLASRR
jgi:wobble nucleotide-excising tRNase